MEPAMVRTMGYSCLWNNHETDPATAAVAWIGNLPVPSLAAICCFYLTPVKDSCVAQISAFPHQDAPV
jgi:hypothetical protein